jgi:hypothetical protein
MPRKEINYSNTMMYKIVSNDLNMRDCYVGSTTEFTKRKWNHKSDCTNANSKKHNLKVYKFIRDNGDWDNWSMLLIEMFPCTNHLEYWCEHLNATLNSVVPSRSQKEYTVDHKEQIKQYNVDHKEHITEQQKQYREEHKEQSKQYREANREQFKQYHEDHKEQYKQYCKTNKKHIAERHKQYRNDNIDHIKEQYKQYCKTNKEHIREQSKQYREQHKIKISKYKSTVLICECGCSYTINHKLRHERSHKHKEYEKNRLYYDIQRGLNIIKKLDNYFLNK